MTLVRRYSGSPLLVGVLLQLLLIGRCVADAEQVLHYVISWNGIPAARATVRMTEGQDHETPTTRLDATIRTNAFVDVFWSLRAESWGQVDGATLRPSGFEYVRRINGRLEATRVEARDHQLTGRYSRPGRYHLIEVNDPDVLDPIAAVLHALRARLAPEETKTYEVFTGEARYRISLRIRGSETIEVPAGRFAAIRIDPTIWRVEEHKEDKRVRRITLWVSEALPHTLLRVRSEVFIGALYVELTDSSPAGVPAAVKR